MRLDWNEMQRREKEEEGEKSLSQFGTVTLSDSCYLPTFDIVFDMLFLFFSVGDATGFSHAFDSKSIPY